MPDCRRLYEGTPYCFTIVIYPRIPILIQDQARDIHFNPVKHRIIKMPREWPWSSFHRYVRDGYDDVDWGQASEYWGASKLRSEAGRECGGRRVYGAVRSNPERTLLTASWLNMIEYDLGHLQDKEAKAQAAELLDELKKCPQRRF